MPLCCCFPVSEPSIQILFVDGLDPVGPGLKTCRPHPRPPFRNSVLFFSPSPPFAPFPLPLACAVKGDEEAEAAAFRGLGGFGKAG